MSRVSSVATVQNIRGRDGACDVVLEVGVPHGKRTRQIDVPLRPEFVLALADAIRCCPQNIMENPRTGERGVGPEAIYVNLRHAVWHLEHPDRLRPCLPTDAHIIDVDAEDERKALGESQQPRKDSP